MWCEVFLRLLLAHVIGDFVLQTDEWCGKKLRYGLNSWHIYSHSLIIFLLSWCVLWCWSAWWIAMIVGGSHLLIDALKRRDGLWPFVWDQAGHLGILVMVGYWVLKKDLYGEFCWDSYHMLCLIVFLLNAKPANILIKLLLGAYSVNVVSKDEKKDDEARIQSGKLIGNIERWLIIIFILCEQYEAVGFLIAAKSIIRYKEGDTLKTEYVLAGTLLSVFIAVISGLILNLRF